MFLQAIKIIRDRAALSVRLKTENISYWLGTSLVESGSCHKRQKPQAPIRNRQTRKVANAKGLNALLTLPNLT